MLIDILGRVCGVVLIVASGVYIGALVLASILAWLR